MPEPVDTQTLDELLDECQTALQYPFHDLDLLTRCLTHASLAKTRLASNERLEFLGDAIMGAIICEILYRRFPEFPEGELTRIKSIVVSRSTCARISEKLGLERFLLLGKGLTTHETIPPSILAAVWESIIAGIYLDGGLEATKRIIERMMGPEIQLAAQSSHGQNYKSMLQQLSQKKFGETPVYTLLDERGPDHSKCFHIAAVVGSRLFPAAWGPSKKEAEQSAAHNALTEIIRDTSDERPLPPSGPDNG